MHREQINFVRSLKNNFPTMFYKKRVLEVGSLNINGSVRSLFTDCHYIGIDLDFGPDVDLVAEGQSVKFADNFFDVVISCECFEHNPYWVKTFENMIRMSSRLVIMTCASEGRAEHGTVNSTSGESPFTAHSNYYQNLNEKDFQDNIDINKYFSQYKFIYNDVSHDLYFWGLVNA